MSISVALLAAVFAALWWADRRRYQAAIAQHAGKLAALNTAQLAVQQEERKRLESLFDSMVEGLLVLDAAGRITQSNRAIESLFGFSRLMLGGTLLEAVRNHEVAALAARLATEPVILDHELRLEGIAPRFLRVNCAALNDVAGLRSGAVFVFHDITRLRDLENARQEFVANVSHELRTPLSLIKSAVETLIDGARVDPVALDRLLTIINRHANRLTLLIDDLLMLAKLESGRVSLNLEPCALRTAVQIALDDLAQRANARTIRMENMVPEGLLALADAERLGQVLSNLIDNGIKYGRVSGVLRISGRRLDNGWVEVSVCDDGPGIPPESQARIFERFYRVDKARSREQGGTGLGLSIVKHVVLAHSGKVRVESEVGRGASFSFTLQAA